MVAENPVGPAARRKYSLVFVDQLSEVPDGSTVIFSAHGVSQAVRADAQSRNLRVFDAANRFR
jgi:4-hydroxy-3-methylbut-2-enyl diphosphate reductase